MKKMLALGAMAVVLGLGYGMPTMAVATDGTAGASASVAVISAADVAAAVARAEEAIAVTTGSTVNVTEVAAMQAYLRKWVAQARTLDLEQLTAGQLKELAAALNEGARGLRMTAGVDRKVASESSSSEATSSADAVTVNAVIAEPRAVKELPAENTASAVSSATVSSSVKTSAGSSSAAVSTKAETAVVLEVTKASTTDMNALATLAVAQVKKPTVALASATTASAGAENTEVDVPKTGADDEEKQASSAVRGMGLVLGGAVVLAAVGAVLIVKRMKRGL